MRQWAMGWLYLMLHLLLVSSSRSLAPPPDLILVDTFPSAPSDTDLHCYRKPALLSTSKGALLAFAERSTKQAGGSCWGSNGSDVAVVVRRSKDGGRSWSDPLMVITGSSRAAIGNPAPVEDSRQDKILLLVSKTPGFILQLESDNSGLSWSNPVNITAMVTAPPWQGGTPVPGYPGGIQMASGRLVVGLHSQKSFIIFSDDGGKTWHRSAPTSDSQSSVSQVAAFYNHPKDLIMVAQGVTGPYLTYSNDSGKSWYNQTAPNSLSTQSHTGSSILGIPYTGVYKDTHLYITEPAYPVNPQDLRLFHSIDGGATWKADFQLWMGPSARSSLAHDENYTKMLCLFECGKVNETENIKLAIFSPMI